MVNLVYTEIEDYTPLSIGSDFCLKHNLPDTNFDFPTKPICLVHIHQYFKLAHLCDLYLIIALDLRNSAKFKYSIKAYLNYKNLNSEMSI